MELKMNTKSTYHVDSFDLEDFVFNLLGIRLEFADNQESGNDTSHEFKVTDTSLDEYDQQRVDKFISGAYVPFVAGDLLNWLCVKGKIPAGSYVVRVSW